MKVSLVAFILISFANLSAGGKRVEGWIFALDQIPISVVPWHPLGEFLVLHEGEFVDIKKAIVTDIEPLHTWITVDD